MITNKQIKELERLFNNYSRGLEAHKDEEQRYNDMMLGVYKAVGILGYEMEFEGEYEGYGEYEEGEGQEEAETEEAGVAEESAEETAAVEETAGEEA